MTAVDAQVAWDSENLLSAMVKAMVVDSFDDDSFGLSTGRDGHEYLLEYIHYSCHE